MASKNSPDVKSDSTMQAASDEALMNMTGLQRKELNMIGACLSFCHELERLSYGGDSCPDPKSNVFVNARAEMSILKESMRKAVTDKDGSLVYKMRVDYVMSQCRSRNLPFFMQHEAFCVLVKEILGEFSEIAHECLASVVLHMREKLDFLVTTLVDKDSPARVRVETQCSIILTARSMSAKCKIEDLFATERMVFLSDDFFNDNVIPIMVMKKSNFMITRGPMQNGNEVPRKNYGANVFKRAGIAIQEGIPDGEVMLSLVVAYMQAVTDRITDYVSMIIAREVIIRSSSDIVDKIRAMNGETASRCTEGSCSRCYYGPESSESSDGESIPDEMLEGVKFAGVVKETQSCSSESDRKLESDRERGMALLNMDVTNVTSSHDAESGEADDELGSFEQGLKSITAKMMASNSGGLAMSNKARLADQAVAVKVAVSQMDISDHSSSFHGLDSESGEFSTIPESPMKADESDESAQPPIAAQSPEVTDDGSLVRSSQLADNKKDAGMTVVEMVIEALASVPCDEGGFKNSSAQSEGVDKGNEMSFSAELTEDIKQSIEHEQSLQAGKVCELASDTNSGGSQKLDAEQTTSGDGAKQPVGHELSEAGDEKDKSNE